MARGRAAPRRRPPGGARTAGGAAAAFEGAHDLPAHGRAVRDARDRRPLAGRGQAGAVVALRAAEEPARPLVPRHPLPLHALPPAAADRGTARGAPGRVGRAVPARARRQRPTTGGPRHRPRRRHAGRADRHPRLLRGGLRRRQECGPRRRRDRLRRDVGHLADGPGRCRAERPAAHSGAHPGPAGRRALPGGDRRRPASGGPDRPRDAVRPGRRTGDVRRAAGEHAAGRGHASACGRPPTPG